MENVVEISETKMKTNKTCFSMFEKWQTTLSETEKGRTVAHYINACINGYPKNTKLNPGLLKTRLNGIKNHAETNGIKLNPDSIEKAVELIEKYKTTFKSA